MCGGGINSRSMAAASCQGYLAELDHGRFGTGSQRCRSVAEHAQFLGGTLAQPSRDALEAAVLDQALEQLGLRLLGRQVVQIVELTGEEQPHLDLEQRGHQHQELAGRLEVELALVVRPADVGDHDLCDRNVGQLDLLAQHQREQQVEWSVEDVEVELEIGEDHSRHSRRPGGWRDEPVNRTVHHEPGAWQRGTRCLAPSSHG